MSPNPKGPHVVGERAIQVIVDALPRSVPIEVPADDTADLIIGNQAFHIKWVGEGSLGRVRALLDSSRRLPDIVVARIMSPGARALLSGTGIGWVDETGAAEIAREGIIVSKAGLAPPVPAKPNNWTPSILAVTEALLSGATATVAATRSATGLSVGSCTRALSFLTERRLLAVDARRGPASARRIADPNRLLEAYAAKADANAPRLSLSVGATWRDPIAWIAEAGVRWNQAGILWAATGTAGAAVLAPLLTNIATIEVYVDTKTPAGLAAIAAAADLRPIDGGRLTLRPLPTPTTLRLATTLDGIRVAPWPRVFVDLRRVGVRGEQAAEHLREEMHGT